jgi:hypothetical protein
MQPPMCLQYIVMASAAETSDIYRHLGMVFYKRAIKYLQDDDSGVCDNHIPSGHLLSKEHRTSVKAQYL